MRNLKKILALVLAMVMAFSVMSVAGATFTDEEDFDGSYAEAAEVLEGLGVFKGYPDDSFRPEQTITRAEVAALIYRIATGDVNNLNIALYKYQGKFTDVDKDHWAAGYINYCANAEYIRGTSATTFDPEAKVTGYQVLAMILRAVGYDKNKEFTGTDWEIQVARVANDLQITGTVAGVSLRDAAPRQIVAELLFQTLNNAKMVTYTPALGYQSANLLSGVTPQTLGTKVFGLKCGDTEDLDQWGRPGYKWTWNGGVAAVIEEPYLAQYFTPVKECDVASVLYLDKNVENAIPTLINGKNNKTVSYVNAVDTINTIGAQGRLTEIYWDRIVMIDTLLAQVTNVTNAKFDVAGHRITPAQLTLTVYDAKTNTADAKAPSTTNYVIDGGSVNFEYVVGDMLLINAVAQSATSNKVAVDANKYCKILSKAPSVQGSQTVIWYNSNQHTVNGTTYSDANTFYLDEAQQSTTNYTWYFDGHDNLIGSTIVKTAKTYGVISNIWWYNDGTNGGTGACYATMVGMDGQSYSAKISSIDGFTTTYVGSYNPSASTNPTINQAGYRDTTNKLIYVSPYSVNNADANMIANDLYEITTQASGNLDLVAMPKLTNATVNTQLSAITGTEDGATATKWTNSSTQYLVFDGGSFTTYAGFNNILNYTKVPVSYVANTSTGYVQYAYIIGNPASQTSGKLIYVEKAGWNYDATSGIYTILNVNVDGVAAQQIQTKDKALVDLLVKATDKLFYVDFTGSLAVMDNEVGTHETHEITSTPTEALNEIDPNLNVVCMDEGGYLTADGLSATPTASDPVYNVTGITPVVGEFEADMSTKGIYLVYKTVGTLNVVTRAYVTESKVAQLAVAAGTVDVLTNLADQTPITVTAVAKANYEVDTEVDIILTRGEGSSFAANSSFTITLNNGRTVTATTGDGPQSQSLTFKYQVLPSDVLSYVQTLVVVAIAKD